MTPGATTRVFALLGDPVAHSLSPRMQNAGFRAAGLDAVYVAVPCIGEDLAGMMRILARAGGGGNVTVPHKALAAQAGSADDAATAVGAANAFGGRDGALVVGNTDVPGLEALLDRLRAGATAWAIVGTGGSARAAVVVAQRRGARIWVQSRTPTRQIAFQEWAVSRGVGVADPAECEVVINATPIGLSADDPMPVQLRDYPAVRAVADLTYRRDGSTALVAAARAAGLAAADGREMLLVQGMAAWALWFPGVTPPEEVMRAALRSDVG